MKSLCAATYRAGDLIPPCLALLVVVSHYAVGELEGIHQASALKALAREISSAGS